MAAQSQGVIRPITPVSLETLEKRVRRALAPRCCSLLKTRSGTPDRNELGLYAVVDHKRVVIERNANLESLARYIGVMEDHEALATDVPERWLPVTIRMVNEQAVTVGHRFSVKAKHLNKSTGAILRDGAVELWRNVDQARCAEILMKLLTDWRNVFDSDGEPMEFNRENLVMMLRAFPHSGKAIGDALLEAIAKGGTQNA